MLRQESAWAEEYWENVLMLVAAWVFGSPKEASTHLFHHGSQSKHILFSETRFQGLSYLTILLGSIRAGNSTHSAGGKASK